MYTQKEFDSTFVQDILKKDEIEIVISPETAEKVKSYYEELRNNPDQLENIAGYFLKQRMKKNNKNISTISVNEFLSLLIESKLLQVYSECQVSFSTAHWTLKEADILAGLVFGMHNTQFFNTGARPNYQNHSQPINGNIITICGVLLCARKSVGSREKAKNNIDVLRNIQWSEAEEQAFANNASPDMIEVMDETKEYKINQERYKAIIKKRLLTVFYHINKTQERLNKEGKCNKKAVINIPGIGTGVYCPEEFQPTAKALLYDVLLEIIKENVNEFTNIDLVHYDPFVKVRANGKYINTICGASGNHQIFLRVCDREETNFTEKLEYPTGTNADTHTVYAVMPADFLAHKGNDTLKGLRTTDEGSIMFSSTALANYYGIPGEYKNVQYEPGKTRDLFVPANIGNENEHLGWKQLINLDERELKAPIYVLEKHKKTPLNKYFLLAEQDLAISLLPEIAEEEGSKLNRSSRKIFKNDRELRDYERFFTKNKNKEDESKEDVDIIQKEMKTQEIQKKLGFHGMQEETGSHGMQEETPPQQDEKKLEETMPYWNTARNSF